MKKLHYSWIILFVTFVSIIVAGIIRSSSGLFIIPFEEQFNWSRATISLAFAVGLFMYGFSGPFMAAFVEIFGLKRMMMYSMALLACGLALTFVMTAQWQLIIIWGVIIGIGSGLFLTVLSTQIANRWFVRHRGLALGLLTAATATGQLVLLPVLAILIEKYNWQTAILLILILSIIMLFVILLFMKESPQSMAIKALGDFSTSESLSTDQEKQRNPFTLVFRSLIEGSRNKTFWLLAASFFICGLSTSGLIGTHFISLCMTYGITALAASSLLSFMGIFDLIGTTISGYLSDKIDNRWLLFWYYSLRGLSLLALPFALNSGSYTWLLIFAIFYGLDWIATVPPTIGLARQEFGLQKSAMMYGWILAFHQLGSSFAAYGGGVIFEVFSSYKLAFILAGAFCLLGSLFVILIKKPQMNEEIS